MKKAAILHGAGYVGRALIESLLHHPKLELVAVTSRTFAGDPIWKAHPHLRGRSDLLFTSDYVLDADVVFIAAGHGKGATVVGKLKDLGFGGIVVDMSADFRLPDPAVYASRYKAEHPHPELLPDAWYGMPEITGAPPEGTTLIANPGCFASALSLVLHPLAKAGISQHVSVTAITGASGSGASPSVGTHFPSRSGNIRAYKVLSHQHEAEIDRMAPELSYSFVPVSGPWTKGIWGTAQLQSDVDLAKIYNLAYGECPLIRLWPNQLPELHWSVDTPFTDIGWIQKENQSVIGFGLDNLRKGAATQAIQNINLAFNWPETTGLVR